ncbi:MAG: tRNA (N6-isopentenyl adenosine(37)-C2)-methylthiotransferase MiaB [Desulfobacterales bacterium GWB2_56_26]|nr:MAG: tRNA (N6-isopentenyl adenosine(37)-C2)-methylthiotransferase MiaB [Desulfobacterales bacterium GWB2_56_26]
MEQKIFYIKTFGCQMNERDSEIMAQSLSGYGYIEGMEMNEADLVILNTCSIRAKAEQKVLSLLGYLRKTKLKRPAMKICVAGCVAQQEGNRLLDRMPHIDLVIGTQNIYNIGPLLLRAETDGSRVVTELRDDYAIPKFLPALSPMAADRAESACAAPSIQFSKFVTIMQGCNNYCTYCVVPYTRGREISRNVDDIIEEVNILVKAGVKEITLLGQNVNSYGKANAVTADRRPYNFSDLLREVSSVEGLARLRFTTSNPKDLTDALMKSFRDVKNLCPQFHLPVQSGSDRILKSMNRKYTAAQYLEKVEKLREYMPGIALTTDIIVGFPGESDEDFQDTMNLLEEVRFHGSFSFKYSDRPGTQASKLAEKVDERVKMERLAVFQQRQDEISLLRNREYVGHGQSVMLEECSESGGKGRTGTNHIVHFSECRGHVAGDIVRMKIVHAGQHSLRGEIEKTDEV